MMTSAPHFTPQVKKVLSNYASESPGILNNLAKMLCTGNLAGTGKMVILPVDQGFEHGPARSFAVNADGYDPYFHYQLAIESGCNAYAAPLGFLEAGAAEFAGQIPTILKLNNSDSLFKDANPCPALTASVKDALRLGCSAIGFTIYPGSTMRNEMYQQIRDLIREAREVGLPTVLWAYARGEELSKEGETAIDVIAYAAQIAAQLGAHVIKVKPPTDALGNAECKKVYESENIPVATLEDRARHVVQSAFNGRRIVIFSGGPAKGEAEVIEETKQLAAGGAFGAIVGRNAFQRPKAEAIKLLNSMQEIYKSA